MALTRPILALTAAALSLLMLGAQALALPAFPGAEGFGTDTPGGRGGKVVFVDNLNDDGPGSLRAALAVTGPRIVVFRTGGLITLKTGLILSEGSITIAGQTAPGDGICLKAAPEMENALLTVKAGDVIIRGMRFRPGGEGKTPSGDNRDSLALGTTANYSEERGYGRAQNIVVDRCSLSWGVDENLQVWYKNRNITVQNCIIAEGLHMSIHSKSQNPPPAGVPAPQSHSFGLLVGGGGTLGVSIHHNLFAHNYGRNPRVDGRTSVEIINNVVYDQGFRSVDLVGGGGPILANIIGNTYKPGATRNSNKFGVFITPGKSAPDFGSAFYLRGNIGATRTADDQDEWEIAGGWTDRQAMQDQYRRNEPALKPSGIVADADAATAYERVLTTAGALPRDAVDLRIVADVRNGTGKIISNPQEVGGWPSYAPGTAPADADNDGMPDEWEREKGLNPAADDSAGTNLSPEGYTNIEVYINGLLGK